MHLKQLQQTPIALFIATLLSSAAVYAHAEVQLEAINVTAEAGQSANPLSSALKPNEIQLNKTALQKRASTLGNALNGELGVHSSQFGGGSSAPIIRGQEGVRLKVLQNGLDVVDMSQLSPDHAITTDTLLANQVEVIRGASTLLYATASPAGVVNVADERIPTSVPEKGYALNLGTRYNTNSKEKVQNGAVTFGVGKHLVVRAEGLHRSADNYRVPTLQFNDNTVHNLPNSFNKSQVGTVGLSLVGERGYLGAAYSNRHDRYGLVGHNHKFDSCYGHIVNPLNAHFVNRYYLHPYPHLMDDSDVIEGAHFDCGSGHENSASPSHSHPFGHNIVGGPFIDLRLKRLELRGEWKKPLPMLSKIRANVAATNYYHDEREGNSDPVNVFNNKGKNVRLEFFHEPIHGWRGVWGVQYQTQTSSAYVPRLSNPPRQLDYVQNEFDRIIRDINGATPAPKRQRQTQPTLGGTFSSENANNLKETLKDLFISPSDKTAGSSASEREKPTRSDTFTPTTPHNTSALGNLIRDINNQPTKPISANADLDENEEIADTPSTSKPTLSPMFPAATPKGFADLIKEINNQPSKPATSASEDDKEEDVIQPRTARAALPSLFPATAPKGLGDLLKDINSQPEKPTTPNDEEYEDLDDNTASTPPSNTQPNSGSFSDLLKDINSQPSKPSAPDEDLDDDSASAQPNSNKPKSGLPSVDSEDLISNLNRKPNSGSFGDLLNDINNQPSKPNEPDEDLDEDSVSAQPNSNAPKSGLPSIGVDELVRNIDSTPKRQANPTNNRVPTWEERSNNDRHYALIENTAKQWSVFGMEQLVWRDFLFELGLRHERQTVRIDYDHALLARSRGLGISSKVEEPNLAPDRKHATSYSAAMYWNFKPEYLLSLILSHNERLPTPMELYYHGSHLATNSFEYGNKDLAKEVSNNVEIGLNYQQDRWSYTANVYYNQFKNRIFKRTLNKEGNLSMNRYAQARAAYYGVEGKLDYQLTDKVQIGVFGDYVRGILKDLPTLRLKDSGKNTYELAANKNAPRVPPARVGAHLAVQFNENLGATVRYTHAFAQKKVAVLEEPTKGYHQLDLGLSYQNRFFGGDYELFLDANNVLNAKVYSHASFLPFVPQMGRNFVFGVNVSF